MTIGYLEAWQLWFAGQQPPGDAVMWFMSVRWWGRAGKIAAFFGGATVILDLIGPDRLRVLGRRARGGLVVQGTLVRLMETSGKDGEEARAQVVRNISYFSAILALVLLVLQSIFILAKIDNKLLAVLLVMAAAPLWFLYTLIPLVFAILIASLEDAVATVLDTDQPAQAFRYVGASLLFVGFHFDLLAS